MISFKKGKHTYLHILTVHLDDFCGRGTAWDTWNNLGLYHPRHPHHHQQQQQHHHHHLAEILETGNWDSFPSELSWVDFRGDWGNQQKMVVNDNDDDNDEKETTITMTKIMIRRRLTPSKNGKQTFLSYVLSHPGL